MFFKLFAGVSMDEMDTFPLIPLGCWLFTIGIYLLIISFRFGMNRQNMRFAMVRYRYILRWWKIHFLKNLLDGVLAAIILLGLFKIIDLLVLQKFMGSLKEILVISILWIIHAITLSVVFLFLEILNIRKMLPAAILLFEGFTFLGGFRFKEIARFMFGSWGMYVQSNLYEDMYGFSVISVILTQAAIMIGLFYLGGYLLKSKEMEGV